MLQVLEAVPSESLCPGIVITLRYSCGIPSLKRSQVKRSQDMRQELSDIRTAPSMRCGTGPLARAGHLDERDAAPTGLEHLGRSPAFFPIPSCYFSHTRARGRSRADFLPRSALYFPVYFSTTCSPRARRSATRRVGVTSRTRRLNLSVISALSPPTPLIHHCWPPSTFDRLP